MLNRVIIAGTGSAGFSLFHPLDLAHRLESAVGWEFDDVVPELADGRLVTFGTSGDGGHSFRVTDGGLTSKELARRVCGWDFRYTVQHGQVFLGGGDDIPMNQQAANPLDEESPWINRDCWIELQNGDYRVSIHEIDHLEGPDYEPIPGFDGVRRSVPTGRIVRRDPVDTPKCELARSGLR